MPTDPQELDNASPSPVLPAVRPGLTPGEFSDLADVPLEVEWLANITNERTQRAYKADVAEFIAFSGLKRPAELRTVARAHVIAWRKDMKFRELSDATIRRKGYFLGPPVKCSWASWPSRDF